MERILLITSTLLQLCRVLGIGNQGTNDIFPENSVERIRDSDNFGIIYYVPTNYPSAKKYSSMSDVPALSVCHLILTVIRTLKNCTDEVILNIIQNIKKKASLIYVPGRGDKRQNSIKVIKDLHARHLLNSLRKNENWMLKEMIKNDRLIILDSPTARYVAKKAVKLLDNLRLYGDYFEQTNTRLEEISRSCLDLVTDIAKYSVNETAATKFRLSYLDFFNKLSSDFTTLLGDLWDISEQELLKLDEFNLLKKNRQNSHISINIQDFYNKLISILQTYEYNDLFTNFISVIIPLKELDGGYITYKYVFDKVQKVVANLTDLVLNLDTIEKRNLAANILKSLHSVIKYRDNKKRRKIFENVKIVDYFFKLGQDILKYAVSNSTTYSVYSRSANKPGAKMISEISIGKLKSSDRYGVIYEVPDMYTSERRANVNKKVPAMSTNHYVLAAIRAVKSYRDKDILKIINSVKQKAKLITTPVKEEQQKKYLKMIDIMNPKDFVKGLRQNEYWIMATNDRLLILDSPKTMQIAANSMKLLEDLNTYSDILKRTPTKLDEISKVCLAVVLDLAKYSINETIAVHGDFLETGNLTTLLGALRDSHANSLLKLDEFKLLRKNLRYNVPEINIRDYYTKLINILKSYKYNDLIQNILTIALPPERLNGGNISFDVIFEEAQALADETNISLRLDTAEKRNLAANIMKSLHIVLKHKDKKHRNVFETSEIVDYLYKIGRDLFKYAAPPAISYDIFKNQPAAEINSNKSEEAFIFNDINLNSSSIFNERRSISKSNTSMKLSQEKPLFEDSLKKLKAMDIYNLIHESNVSNDKTIDAKNVCNAILNVLESFKERDLKEVLRETELILNRLKKSPKSKVGYIWKKLMGAVTLMKQLPPKGLVKYIEDLKSQVQDEQINKVLKVSTEKEINLAEKILKFLNDLTVYRSKTDATDLKRIIANGFMLVSDFKALSRV